MLAEDTAELLERIRAGEVAVFCGAGISRKSGIPIVHDIESHILDRLGASPELIEIVATSALPFEAFMEALDEGRAISSLLGVFSGGKPNANHELIAYLVKAGLLHTVNTTNFDVLIEGALEAAGLTEGSGFARYSNRGDFDALDWSEKSVRLIKLHGSIERPDEIAVTLRDVAGKVWTKGTQSVIERTFCTGSHAAVLILGYSCSDLFDLSPQIEALDGPQKRVFLVDHRTEPPFSEDIAVKTVKNPFSRWKDGRRLCVDTDWLVSRIREVCVPAAAPTAGATQLPDWRSIVTAWAPDTGAPAGQSEAAYLVATLLVRISRFSLAHEQFQRGLDLAADDKQRARCHIGLGLASEQLADHDATVSHAKTAVELGEKIGDATIVRTAKMALGSAYLNRSEFASAEPWIREAAPDEKEALSSPGLAMAALNNLGLVRLGLGQFDDAISTFETCAKISVDIGNKREEGNAWTNIGNVNNTRGDNRAELQAHEKALETFRSIGDRWGEVTALNHVGIAQKNLGDYASALASNEASLKLAEEMGDARGVMFAHASLALACQHQGRVKDALHHTEQAMAFSDRVDDEKAKAGLFVNLGRIYLGSGEPDQAEDTLRRGVEIAERIGDATLLTSLLGLEASLNSARGDLARAYELYGEVFERAEKAGLKKVMATSLQSLGSTLSDLGRLEEAFKMTSGALQFAEEIGDEDTQTFALNGLGVIQKKVGNYPAAIELYEAGLVIARRTGNRSGERTLLGNLAISYGKVGRLADMKETATAALAIAREIGDKASEGSHLGTLANAAAAENDPQQALQLLQEALALFHASGSRREEAMTLDNIASTLANLERYQEALEWFQRAHDVAVTVYGPDERFMLALAQKIAAAQEAAGVAPPSAPSKKGRGRSRHT